MRATIAIVRRHIDRRFALDFAMQFALVAAIGWIFAYAFAAPLVCVVACGALAAASAAEREHAAGLRRVSFFAMPLYGRQLARAHAIAPVVSALSIPFGYVVGSTIRGATPPAITIVALVLATIVAALVSLSSVFRDGIRAVLYVVLGLGAAATIAFPLVAFPAHALPIACAIAIVEGFLALRAFGETLARYDPVL
jgi:hypothetical protein